MLYYAQFQCPIIATNSKVLYCVNDSGKYVGKQLDPMELPFQGLEYSTHTQMHGNIGLGHQGIHYTCTITDSPMLLPWLLHFVTHTASSTTEEASAIAAAAAAATLLSKPLILAVHFLTQCNIGVSLYALGH